MPAGTYRFVVDGKIHTGGKATDYHLQSDTFQVTPWDGLKAGDPSVVNGDVVVATDPVVYPRSYTPDASNRFIKDDHNVYDNGPSALCRTCAFRPWAQTGRVASVTVSVTAITSPRSSSAGT